MQWVDILQDLTGWQAARLGSGWANTEAELGVSLPDDFKEGIGGQEHDAPPIPKPPPTPGPGPVRGIRAARCRTEDPF